MKNTWIKLNSVRCDKLLAGLESLSMSDRDQTWNHLIKEIKQVKDIWAHIDIKTLHNNKINERAKVTNKKHIRSNK